MAVLVDYRRKFIGFPEFAEEKLGVVYGYIRSPAGFLLMGTLFIAGYVLVHLIWFGREAVSLPRYLISPYRHR